MRVALLVALAAATLLTACNKEPVMETHLTIYLDPAIVRDGGMVIVSAIPVPDAEWQAMPVTDEVAMLDPTNPKGADVGPEDRHFGVIIRSPAASVEFPVPEGGTYTFNLLPEPTVSGPKQTLQTMRIGIGSGSGLFHDPDTGGPLVEWSNVSDIAILGDVRGETWALGRNTGFANAVNQQKGVYFTTHRSIAGRVIELTELGLAFAESGRTLP